VLLNSDWKGSDLEFEDSGGFEVEYLFTFLERRHSGCSWRMGGSRTMSFHWSSAEETERVKGDGRGDDVACGSVDVDCDGADEPCESDFTAVAWDF